MPLKILLLSHRFSPDVGGIENVSEFLAQSFIDAGHKIHVLTWSKDPSNRKFPYKVVRNPNLMRLFNEHIWADLVFENNPCLRLAWPNFFFKCPSIVGLHTWISRTDGKVAWQDQIKLIWLKRSQQVIACSDAIRKRNWPNATVITNSYQEKTFRILPGTSRTNDFVFVGRLVSDKGVDLAIKALARLISETDNKEKNFSKRTLTIIGDGPELSKLKNMVSVMGLESNVIFSGILKGEELVKSLNRHKYLLVPSVWEEPFGIVVLEGMACGCIPITSDGGGLPEAVGKAGLVFKRNDLDSFVTTIESLLGNPVLEEKLRSEALAHLEAHHTAVIADEYLRLFEKYICQQNQGRIN